MNIKLSETKFGNFECFDDPGEIGYPGNPRRKSVTTEEAEILQELVKGLVVLEIGTGLGVATRAMAKTARTVTSIDIDPWCHSFEFPDNVILADKIPKLKYDFAFIDGNHSFVSVCKDIGRVNAPLLAIHDTYIRDVMRAIEHTGLKTVETFNTACRLMLCSR